MEIKSKMALIKFVGEIVSKPDTFEKDVRVLKIMDDGQIFVTLCLSGKIAQFVREMKIKETNHV